MEYWVPCSPVHTVIGPLMIPGVDGAPFTFTHLAVLVPQLLLAVTHNWPVVKLPEKVTSTVLLPLALARVAPEGKIQL